MALAVVLVVAAGTAVAVTVGATGGRGHVPLGLAALGAVLGVVAFGIRQWWERPGRGRH